MRPLSDYDFDKEIEVNDNVVVEDDNEEFLEGSTYYAEGEVKEGSCYNSRCKHLKVAVTIFAIVLFVYGVASSIQLYRYNRQICQYSITVNRLEHEMYLQTAANRMLEKELKSVLSKNTELSKTVKSQKKKIDNLTEQNKELSEKVKQSTNYSANFTSSNSSSTGEYSTSYFMNAGDINWNGWRWTWYSQKVLPGPGLNIPGRHVDNQYVCDGDGYICLANDVYELGQVISTPFGKQGKVYDRITDDRSNTTTVDVYTNF